MIDVSVVIAVSGVDLDRLDFQLGQLSRQDTDREFEVIVACNSETVTSHLTSRNGWAKVVDASAVRGAAFARNTGVRHAVGGYVLFCDADDLVAPHWIEAHARALDRAEFTGGPFLIVDDGSLVGEIVAGRWPCKPTATQLRMHEGLTFATSANMGIHRDAFDRAGGFPERYLRSQDVALNLRLRELGVVPTFVSDAVVAKVDKTRGRREQLAVEFHAGAATVDLMRDYRVGPGAFGLVVRSLGRSGRSLGRLMRGPADRGKPPTLELARAGGVLVRLVSRRAVTDRSRSTR
jgi:GT2 family glycosyltransferase